MVLLNLNTRYSSAVAQRALLVFEINLEYVIDIIVIINNNIVRERFIKK